MSSRYILLSVCGRLIILSTLASFPPSASHNRRVATLSWLQQSSVLRLNKLDNPVLLLPYMVSTAVWITRSLLSFSQSPSVAKTKNYLETHKAEAQLVLPYKVVGYQLLKRQVGHWVWYPHHHLVMVFFPH